MKRSYLPNIAGILSASLLAAVPAVKAATASTDPLGYTTINCLWDSDTLCSTAGITEKPDFIGKVTGAPVSDVLTVDATPGWTANEFANTHYVRFTTGTKVGRFYKVTANASGTLTVDPDGDNLSTVVANDGVKLVKFWTLGTLFPQATQTTVVQSSGNLGFQRRTEILFPDMAGMGINLSPTAQGTYFLKSTGWVTVSGFGASDDELVMPDSYFIVRHPPQSQSGGLGDASGTEFVPMGHVETSPTTIILSSQPTGSGEQDNSVALARPVAVALNEANLIGSGAFQASNGTLGFQRRDELLVFDLNVDTIAAEDSGQNRASVNTYYYNSLAGNWVNTGNGNSNADTELVFQPGTGVIIRKYNLAGGASTFWVFDPQAPSN